MAKFSSLSMSPSGDEKAGLVVLGPGGGDIISSGDKVSDDAARARFVSAYDAKHVNDHGNGTPDFHRKGPLVWMCSNDSDRPGGAGWGCAAGAIAGR